MPINKKLINFKTKTQFDAKLKSGDILTNSIVFIEDTGQIWTHGKFYGGNTIDSSKKLSKTTMVYANLPYSYINDGETISFTAPSVDDYATANTSGGILFGSSNTAGYLTIRSGSTDAEFYVRSWYNSNFSSWRKLYHSGNINTSTVNLSAKDLNVYSIISLIGSGKTSFKVTTEPNGGAIQLFDSTGTRKLLLRGYEYSDNIQLLLEAGGIKSAGEIFANNDKKVWHSGNDGSESGLDADLLDGLHAHSGRNNEANKIVRTDSSGYIQAGYINSSSGNENNNSNPDRVWGSNSTDGYLRTYRTSALSVDNSAKLGGIVAANLKPKVSLRDFTNGTLIRTSIDYSQTNGAAWYLKIHGNIYGNGTTLNLQAQGYIYNNTIINTNAIYFGTFVNSTTTKLIALNVDGKLCFWFARQGYWAGYNVECYDVSRSTTYENLVTSIDNVVDPVGTKRVEIPLSQIYSSAQNNIGTGATNYAAGNHTHSNFASTITTTGSGNAITELSISGNTITATKGSSFLSLSGGTLNGRLFIRKNSTDTYKVFLDTSAASNEFIIGGQASDNFEHYIRIGSNKLIFTSNQGSKNISLEGHTHNYAGSSSAGGAANSAIKLGSITGGTTTSPGDYGMHWSCQVGSTTAGIFPTSNNANAVFTINTHPGHYYHQLGFSGNGNMYRRYFSNSPLNTTQGWACVWDSWNFNPDTKITTQGTITGNIDSDHGEGFITFDPVPTGTPPISSPNIRTINVGNSFGRRTQLAFNYESDRAFFRRRTSEWWTWREFWHTGNFNPDDKLNTTATAADSHKLGGASAVRFLKDNGTVAQANLNSATETGIYNVINGSDMYRMLLVFNNYSGTHSNAIQFWGGWGENNIKYRIRNGSGNTWDDWKTIWHSQNSNLSTIDWSCKQIWIGGSAQSRITSENSSHLHYYTDASDSHWFNKAVRVHGEIYAGSAYNNRVWHTGNFDPSTKLNVSGGTLSGALNFANFTWNNIGDDAALGDYNQAGKVCIKALNSTEPGVAFYNNSGTHVGVLYSSNGTLKWGNHDVSLGTHSHTGITAWDNRGADRAPGYYPSKTITGFFNEAIPSAFGTWSSGLNVCGWDNASYRSWQIFGYSSTSASNEIFIRTSKTDNSWNTPNKLWHNGNLGFGTGESNMARGNHGHTGLATNGWNGVRSTTPSGWIDLGPANADWAHIYTDRPNFYFNKHIYINNVSVSLSNHTHNYAGSSSAGGVATKAYVSEQLEAFTAGNFTDGSHYVKAIRYDGWHTRLYMGYHRDDTRQNTVHVGYADSATYAGFIPPRYDGGVIVNPQQYFDRGIGVRVAMTGTTGSKGDYWGDTLWINGYGGGDVPNCCALHFSRYNARMFLSIQNAGGTSYGTLNEIWHEGNFTVPHRTGIIASGTVNAGNGSFYAHHFKVYAPNVTMSVSKVNTGTYRLTHNIETYYPNSGAVGIICTGRGATPCVVTLTAITSTYLEVKVYSLNGALINNDFNFLILHPAI